MSTILFIFEDKNVLLLIERTDRIISLVAELVSPSHNTIIMIRSLRDAVKYSKPSRKRQRISSSKPSLTLSNGLLSLQPEQYFVPLIQSLYRHNVTRLFSKNQSNSVGDRVEWKSDKKDTAKAKKYSDTPSVLPQTITEQLKSTPNIITLSRLASTPILCYWIIQDNFTFAIFGCVLAGLSDGIDGYVAKYHGGSTVLGTYLDPLADKVLINGLAISLCYSGILPLPLILIWVTKDVALLGGMGFYLWKDQKTVNFFHNSVATKPLEVTPSTFGKMNTVLQFATLGVGILSPIILNFDPLILQSLCWVTGTSSIVTVVSYAGQTGFKPTATNNKNA